MESEPLTFFITYKNQEAVIELSEYQTVGQLKIEMGRVFNVDVEKQDIFGWTVPPICDQTILQVCAARWEVNNLLVVESTCIPSSTDTDTEVQYSGIESSAMDNKQTDYKDLELKAVARFEQKLPTNFPLKFHSMSLNDMLDFVRELPEKKALLLYLHNSDDIFSQQFLKHVYNEEVRSIITHTSFVVGWDVEDDSHHNALVHALELNQELLIISDLITEKVGAAVCLIPSADNQITITFCLRREVTVSSIISYFENLAEMLHGDIDDPPMSIDSELAAIKSLKRKLPANISVNIRQCTLDDAVQSLCNGPLKDRKILLLYLHNSERPFSKMFSKSLANESVSTLLNKHFLVLGWDVEDSNYHCALKNALNRHNNLEDVSNLVTKKDAVALCIFPVRNTIRVFSCFGADISLKQLIECLENVKTTFNEEIEQELELENIETKTSKENDLGSENLQSMWADMLGNRDYDAFEINEHDYLKQKIGFALFGPPQNTTGYKPKELKKINSLFEVIMQQSGPIAEIKDHIEISIIFNCLEPLPAEKIKRSKKYSDYNPKTDVNPVPVFILRKCRDSENPCRIFIDIDERVYNSWNAYLTKNKHPKCQMIVPRNGRYQVENQKVLLESYLSPACHLDALLLQIGDGVTGVAGLASGGVFLIAGAGIAALPVAAPIVIGAGVVGAIAGVWALARSGFTIHDRIRHSQSMSVLNCEARGAYLNIVAGSLGFVGAGANMALAQLVTKGINVGQGATYVVNTIGVLNLGAGGASVLNTGYTIFDQWYNENQTPSALTLLQLGSSVLFFGHAVYSFKGAQTIIDETQARVLQDYQNSLRSNRHRKTFNRLLRDTIDIHSDGTRGRAEVIAAVRNIKNKNEVFAALTRNRSALSKSGVRYAADGGEITLNGLMVDMNEFIGLNKKQSEIFLNNLAQESASRQPNPSINVPNDRSNNMLKTAVSSYLSDIKIDPSKVNISQLVQLTSKLLLFCQEDVQVKVIQAVEQAVLYIMKLLPKDIVESLDRIVSKSQQYIEFIRCAITFFSQKVDEMEKKYQMFEKTGDQSYNDPLFNILNPVLAKRIVQIFEFIVRNSFSGQKLVSAVLTELSKFISAWVARVFFEEEETKNKGESGSQQSATKIKCKICEGWYYSKIRENRVPNNQLLKLNAKFVKDGIIAFPK